MGMISNTMSLYSMYVSIYLSDAGKLSQSVSRFCGGFMNLSLNFQLDLVMAKEKMLELCNKVYIKNKQ